MTQRSLTPCILVRPRIYVNGDLSIGPGKIDLLRQIAHTHSISAAARTLNMPYKRAWLLIDSLNKGIGKPVVSTTTGGRKGGGSCLTELGHKLVAMYDNIESHLNEKSADDLNALQALLNEYQ